LSEGLWSRQKASDVIDQSSDVKHGQQQLLPGALELVHWQPAKRERQLVQEALASTHSTDVLRDAISEVELELLEQC